MKNLFILLSTCLLIFVGCQKKMSPASSDEKTEDPSEEMPETSSQDMKSMDKPMLDPSNFVATVNHPYFNLKPGAIWIYEGKNDEGETEKVQVEVIADDKMVMGIPVTVVRDRVWEEDELVEDTRDWFAQDKEGNVWYMGEDVDNYEDGELVNNDGAWEAGVNNAQAGIIMKATPKVGDVYQQEYLKGEAEDMGEVLSISESLQLTVGNFENCIQTKDWTPLEPEVIEHKYYCQEVGNVVLEKKVSGESGQLELVDYQIK